MALTDNAPLHEVITNFARPEAMTAALSQLGVAAFAIILGYLAAHAACGRIPQNPRWQFGAGRFERVAFPLCAAGFMFLGKLVLQRYQPTNLLHILLTLTLAWVAIRVAAYVLGHILPQGSFLRASIRTISWIAWVAVALHITGFSADVVDALDDIGFSIGKDKQRVTLLLVLEAVAALALTLTLAAWISRITESRVMAQANVEMSTRVVISKLVRVSAIFIAVIVALPMVGIDITALSIFGGALGVGLGFGLQKIASNYVSGFIVLLDHSLRIGDIITVDGKRGQVTAIESRYTVIKGGDGVESIIPNEKLITDSVQHHTYTDPRVSVVIGVTVSYDSDLDTALRLLVEATKEQSRVIPDPPAAARVKQFRDHGVDLELTVWIKDPAAGDGDLRSEVSKAILKSFRQAGIEIPYARRDIRILATPETRENASPSGT
jgi:small-conductance mechanosensitive channel